MLDYVFEIVDKSGRKIHLTKERWRHIVIDHPDLTDRIEEIKLALIKPTIIVPHKYDEDMRNYYRYQKDTHDYLLVVVKYINGGGYVATAFFTQKLMKR